MNRSLLGVIAGIVIVGMLCGCRAMSKDDAPTPSTTPAPTTQEPSTTPAPSPKPAPTPGTNPSESKDISNITALRETLGQSILPLIDGGLLTLQKTSPKGAADPNITLEGGKFEFNQILKGDGGGQGTAQATGSYQKLGTISGGGAIYVNPTSIDFNFDGLKIKSGCHGTLSLTGNVHCSINATYTYGANILSGTGQCMTHTNGILDNITIEIGGTTQKIRYVLGFKIQGDPTDWKAYQWVGTAYVGGISVDLTQLNDSQNTCNK